MNDRNQSCHNNNNGASASMAHCWHNLRYTRHSSSGYGAGQWWRRDVTCPLIHTKKLLHCNVLTLHSSQWWLSSEGGDVILYDVTPRPRTSGLQMDCVYTNDAKRYTTPRSDLGVQKGSLKKIHIVFKLIINSITYFTSWNVFLLPSCL